MAKKTKRKNTRKKSKKVNMGATAGLLLTLAPVIEPIFRGDVGLMLRNAGSLYGKNGLKTAFDAWTPAIFGAGLSIAASKFGVNKRLALPMVAI